MMAIKAQPLMAGTCMRLGANFAVVVSCADVVALVRRRRSAPTPRRRSRV
jgi:hypothetical protein